MHKYTAWRNEMLEHFHNYEWTPLCVHSTDMDLLSAINRYGNDSVVVIYTNIRLSFVSKSIVVVHEGNSQPVLEGSHLKLHT